MGSGVLLLGGDDGVKKEDQYRQQLEELGVWQDAFAEEVHQLAIMERELSRTMKAWKATAEDGKSPSVLDKHYAVIVKQRADILAHRESLGLTPKGLQRLRRGMVSNPDTGDDFGSRLDALMAQVGSYDKVSSYESPAS